MQVVLSERLVSRRVRELENLPAEMTISEITHLMPKYSANLFGHVSNYGVRMAGFIGQNGDIATFSFELSPLRTDEDRATRLSGLAFLTPLSVSLEFDDLSGFYGGLALPAMQNAWSEYCQHFQQITIPELERLLEEIGMKIIFAPPPVARNAAEAMQQEQGYELFLAQAGRKDPLARHNAIEQYREAEEAVVRAGRDARLDSFIKGDGD
jgi:hypothetical protein